jgi:pimeloyl-ACP methyl ester carboxylesterase
MPYITTRDNTNLYVKDWGTGRPVVLIHGWPLNADGWDDVAIQLVDAGFRTIAYDRRGFGRSDQPWSGYDYNTLTDDLADVLEATGATNAALVGFSMGGGEVARYLSRYNGKNVSQVALVSAVVPYMMKTPDNPNGVDPSVFAQMTEGMKKDRAAFFAQFFKDFYGIGLAKHPVSDEVVEVSHHIAMMASLKATLACAESFATTDFRPDLSAFKLPTLVVHGTADKTVPIDVTGREFAKVVPHAKLIEYDGAPHGIFASHKDQLASDLLAFLKS